MHIFGFTNDISCLFVSAFEGESLLNGEGTILFLCHLEPKKVQLSIRPKTITQSSMYSKRLKTERSDF